MIELIEVKDKLNCCGCSSCYSICPSNAIYMILDNEGFCYPKVNLDKCINCGKCEKACPIVNYKKNLSNTLDVYAGFNKNKSELRKSSSGGIFSALAHYFLENNGIVYGASWNENKVNHIRINNLDDLHLLQSSKYIQSNMIDIHKTLKKDLDNGLNVLFTGTPCQIESVYSYLGKNYDNLYTQDIICHGVPSPKLFDKYLSEIDGTNKIVNFRYKEKNWKNYKVLISNNEKQIVNNHYFDPFMRSFIFNYNLRPSCYECKFKKLYRISDITLGDFWGVEMIDKKLMNKMGTSLVFIHNKKGKDLIEKVMNEISLEQISIKDAIAFNDSYYKSSKSPRNRDSFWKDSEIMGFSELVNKYCPHENVSLPKKILKKIL